MKPVPIPDRFSVGESHLAQEAIAALVDGELPSGPAGRAARHLAGCAECRMAVQAQREAKDALHGCTEVTVPGDLLSRLCAIPFTTDVPSGSSLGSLRAGPGGLTMDGASGSWSVDLQATPEPTRPDHARWLRRGVAGTLAGLGLGVALLAFTLPGDEPSDPGRLPVAGPSAPQERTEAVPPVTRTVTLGDTTALSARGSGGSP
jgi:Putative zinc-finger